MEAICKGGDTSVTRACREVTRIVERILEPGRVKGIKMEVDPDTKSWSGSKIRVSVGSKEEAQRLMENLPRCLLE
eukprot:514846-Hanusia_phi.AAC.1